VLVKKGLRLAKTLGEVAPEPPAADFRLRAVKTEHGALRMLALRFAHGFADAHPVAHGGDLAKGDAGLRHAEGAGIHADEDDALRAASKTPQIGFMRRPGVVERLVNIVHRLGKAQRTEGFTQGQGGGDKGGGGHGKADDYRLWQ